MKIAIGSDHAGFFLKEKIKAHLQSYDIMIVDVGPSSNERVDYPDYAHRVCQSIQQNDNQLGIVVCGSGVGISIVCNKHDGISCGLAIEMDTLGQIIKHCNVIALGERIISEELAIKIVDMFIKEKQIQ